MTDRKILFIEPPLPKGVTNTPGIAYLRGYLRSKGFNSKVLNFGQLGEKRCFKDASRRKAFRALRNFERTGFLGKTWHFLDGEFDKYAGLLREHEYLGVSIASLPQFIFSLALAQFAKKTKKTSKIVFGGPFVTQYALDFKNLLVGCSLVDFMVIGEGETALCALLEQWEPKKIPNLIYSERGVYRFSKDQEHHENIKKLAPPIFEKNDTFYIQASRKCYWGKCAFCRFDSNKIKPLPLTRTANDVIADILTIKKSAPSARNFVFTDNALPISFLQAFSRKIIKKRLKDLTFESNLRFENKIDHRLLLSAKKAGFRCFYFGLETTSRRLLGLINKGIRLERAEDITAICSELNIKMTIHFMIGLPTQTEKELLDDLEFACSLVKKHKNIHLEIKPFRLEAGSGIFNHPDKFGIKIIKGSGAHRSFVRPFYRFRQLDKNAISTVKAISIFKRFSSKIKDPRISRLFNKMYSDFCLPTLFLEREMK